jgi:hypothetical protein
MSDDLVNENYSDPFMRQVVDFIASDSFQTKFEAFFLLHSLQFKDKEEHEFHYYELYQQFQDMFNGELQQFCVTHDLSLEEFYKLCQKAIKEDANANHYIQILISSAEYETFVRLMKIMKPIAEIKSKNTQEMKRKKMMKGESTSAPSLPPSHLLLS